MQEVNAAFDEARALMDPNLVMRLLQEQHPYHVQSLLVMFGAYRCGALKHWCMAVCRHAGARAIWRLAAACG